MPVSLPYFSRHSVSQASTSGTGSAGSLSPAFQQPPFSITGINEWHTSSTMISASFSSPPFSITGINEWHISYLGFPACSAWPAIQYHRHQRVARHVSPSAARWRTPPPFSITGINEWHQAGTSLTLQKCFRHSVSQASTSGTLVACHSALHAGVRHSVSQASTSGTRMPTQSMTGKMHRHSVSQASTSGTYTAPHQDSAAGRHSVSQASTSGTTILHSTR